MKALHSSRAELELKSKKMGDMADVVSNSVLVREHMWAAL